MRGFYTIQTQAEYDAWLTDEAARNLGAESLGWLRLL
jgi:hypothetical protein